MTKEIKRSYYGFLISGTILFLVVLCLSILSIDKTINPKAIANIFIWIKIFGVCFSLNAFILVIIYWNLSLNRITKISLTILTLLLSIITLVQISVRNPCPILGSVRLPKEGKIIYVVNFDEYYGWFNRLKGVSVYYHTEGKFRTSPPVKNIYGRFRKLLKYKTHSEIIIDVEKRNTNFFGFPGSRYYQPIKYRIDHQTAKIKEIKIEENTE